ncbi:MAG TPA: DUF3617 family protein [Rhodospirillales bacterium]|nr:DUF3617 family protein [Rhodospirillales bacterium]
MAGALLALGLALVSAVVSAADVDWPKLEPGLWQFTRTMTTGGKPTTVERQGCADPVAEWEKQHQASGRAGCTVETVKAAADRYVTTADCKLPSAGEGSSRSTAVVKGRDAYEVVVENRGVLAKSGEREHLVAKRLGDCPK